MPRKTPTVDIYNQAGIAVLKMRKLLAQMELQTHTTYAGVLKGGIIK